MRSILVRVRALASAVLIACPMASIRAQSPSGSWLDQSQPASWNAPGVPIPAAPSVDSGTEPRCADQARPAELEADRRLRNAGWDLIGAFQGGWQILVIGATAGYDGMCRPREYQDFVFVRGIFAGTLSPRTMDSRTDGALSRVFVQSPTRLTAEYLRYAPQDPLCCASRTTRVVFDIASDGPLVKPVSVSTSANAPPQAPRSPAPRN